MNVPSMTSIAAIASVNTTVSRVRSEIVKAGRVADGRLDEPAPSSAAGTIVPDPVARAADGEQRGPPERPIDLRPQVADVDVHDVGVVVERRVPDGLDQLGPGHDLTGTPHERVEQGELPRGQPDLGVAPADLPGRRVEVHVADGHQHRTL